ncbi:hypothetical protein MTBBW1_190003 [Desulfamplus magnetovallimortis]|uniref:Uncharacterized protein n=1 Tax=Desulfamplus magnetovallimortis TaxID=1246637 RepID=A0A1W1HAW0_9BACT|nr:hypothetical protein MTBBW1_190003 [Desulfamplus magnetovallimortis]
MYTQKIEKVRIVIRQLNLERLPHHLKHKPQRNLNIVAFLMAARY